MNKFESSGNVSNTIVLIRQRYTHSEVNSTDFNQSVREHPTLSLYRRSQKLGISQL